MSVKRFACLLVLFIAVLTICAQAQDVPYVPSPENVVAEMLKTAEVKKTDLVYDLGCGDGRIVVAAAKDYGAHAVGVDSNPDRIREANENASKAGVTDLVAFHQNDLFKEDISKATVVTLYLLPSVNLKLRPRLLKELRPGSRIVSHDFDMGEWAADKQVEVDGHTVYFWVVPPNGPKKDALIASDK
jgi:SAM-dependent methyltransferase